MFSNIDRIDLRAKRLPCAVGSARACHPEGAGKGTGGGPQRAAHRRPGNNRQRCGTLETVVRTISDLSSKLHLYFEAHPGEKFGRVNHTCCLCGR